MGKRNEGEVVPQQCVMDLLAEAPLYVHSAGPEAQPEFIDRVFMLRLDIGDIDATLIEAVSWYGYMSDRASIIRAYRVSMERQKTETFAGLAGERREEAALRGTKITEAAIEQAVRGHPDYHRVCESLNVTLYEEDQLERFLKTLQNRIDALRTVSANRRQDQLVTR